MSADVAKVSGIILAGGKSRRMGRDKAFLEFNGQLLIERVIERVSHVCADVTIVANDVPAYTRFGLPVISDIFPGKGSLGGLYSGLLHAQRDYALAVACDMPFLNEMLLRYLISLAPQYDIVIPRAHDPSSRKPASYPFQPLAKEQDLHPMHAVYSKRCVPIIEQRLRADDLRLIGFLDQVRTRFVEPAEIDGIDPKHLSFFNANTPEDFDFANQLTH